MEQEKKPEEKPKNEKPKYDDKIKSTKDVIDNKLKDQKADYGSEYNFDKLYQEGSFDIPKKANNFKNKLRKAVYNCLPDEGISDPKEIDGLVDKMYSTASNTILEGIKLRPIDKEGEEDLEELIKSYMGNLDKKTLKMAFEEQLKHYGYIDADDEVIRNNMLNLPVRTYTQKKQRRIESKIEEEISTIEGFESLKKEIKSLAEKLNKPVKDEEIFMPNKAWATYVKLRNISRTLQTL